MKNTTQHNKFSKALYYGVALSSIFLLFFLVSCEKEEILHNTKSETKNYLNKTNIPLVELNKKNAINKKENYSQIGVTKNQSDPMNSIISQPPVSQEVGLFGFAEKHVAFIDARIRSLNESTYVKELVFKNFS